VPHRASVGSTVPAPSEEDLYCLLLHRYRKRESVERNLQVRLRQLEAENMRLSDTTKEYEEKLNMSATTGTKQAARLKAQKIVIDDIKKSYSKIKDFMKGVCEDQETLRGKAAALNQERQKLQDESQGFRYIIEEAQNTTASSRNTVNKIRADFTEVRQQTAYLEISLQEAKLELHNERNLLMQEKQRNARYENHIAELTRKQSDFSSTIQREQQSLLNVLKKIDDKIGYLETKVGNVPPPDLPALEQCVEMLRVLTKVETASPGDVADMIRVVQGLTEG
jgi:chromosome segregation ATPase